MPDMVAPREKARVVFTTSEPRQSNAHERQLPVHAFPLHKCLTYRCVDTHLLGKQRPHTYPPRRVRDIEMSPHCPLIRVIWASRHLVCLSIKRLPTFEVNLSSVTLTSETPLPPWSSLPSKYVQKANYATPVLACIHGQLQPQEVFETSLRRLSTRSTTASDTLRKVEREKNSEVNQKTDIRGGSILASHLPTDCGPHAGVVDTTAARKKVLAHTQCSQHADAILHSFSLLVP